jgi:septal ring factor EnvC (AmiA/AmiB activator)
VSRHFCCLFLAGLLIASTHAQTPVSARADTQRRIDARLRALQRENDELAGRSKTLVADLRRLELERDLRRHESQEAERLAAEARNAIDEASARIEAVEQQRVAQLPDLRVQLVDVYKRGRAGNTGLLLSGGGFREFARATRAVGALTTIRERRIAEHRRTLETLAAERAALERRAEERRTREREAVTARAAAERAVTAHAALIARIDAERDLMAQYVGELQVAYQRLQQLASSDREAGVTVPLAPFRGALDWPVTGKVGARFGQASGRLGGSALQNGVEIAAGLDEPVRAIHGGTVGYAEPFTGFGNLVVLDHGGNSYSLYGYLGSIAVERGQTVEAGAELGSVGQASAGPPALYFEIRIDGRSVDPLQWLQKVP